MYVAPHLMAKVKCCITEYDLTDAARTLSILSSYDTLQHGYLRGNRRQHIDPPSYAGKQGSAASNVGDGNPTLRDSLDVA